MKQTIAQIKNLLSMYDNDFFLTEEELLINIALELEDFQKEFMPTNTQSKKEVIIDSIIWVTFSVSSLVTFTYLILY